MGLGLLIGTALAAPLAAPAPEISAQARPPTPRPTGTAAPRAGGFPIELALPLLAGGGAAVGGGLYFLRRGKKP
jgi:hypothetical protein